MTDAFKKYLKKNNYPLNYCTGGFFNKVPLNGSDLKATVQEAYLKYEQMHFPTLAISSRTKKKYRMDRFLAPILDFKMAIITPQFVAKLIEFWKEEYLKRESHQRFNWDKELADLKSFLNWYSNTIDFRYQPPVKAFHKKLGIMREIPRKERVISPEQIKLFLSKLNSKYSDFATLQLLMASRVGEVAGLQIKNIDLENRILIVKEVIVWLEGKSIVKNLPKNGVEKPMYINDSMLEIIKRRLKLKNDDSPFLFSENGRPYQYNLIGAAYNRAWKRAGLSQYSGSHQLRYGMCQIARAATGSLEAVKQLSGHQSDEMARKYSIIDKSSLNQETMIQCDEYFKAA